MPDLAMRLQKTTILIILALIAISCVSASVYEYNSTGFFVNETFDSYNSTMWYNSSKFTISGGQLHWTGTPSSSTYYEFILNDTNFLPNMTDEWDYEAKVSIPSCSAIWGSPTLNLFNVTSFSYPYGGFQHLRPYIANGVSACADIEYTVLLSENKLGNTASSDTFNSLKRLNQSMKNMALYKRNLANGSWYMTAYFDGALLWNLTNNANMTGGLTQNLSNFGGKGRFAIVGYAQTDYAFDIDELVIRNYYYTFPTPETPNTAPTVTINSPANDTSSNTRQNISFTATDPEQANTSCNLYIDSILDLTNSTVLNDTATLFTPLWSVGSHSYYITCYDGTDSGTSETRTFTYSRTLVVTASAPADHAVSGSQINVTFTAVDNKITPMSCNLNIDDFVNTTNGAVANNTLTTFPIAWTVGTHLWNVTCSDGEITGASAMRTFTFNSSHSLVLWNPANATRTNVNENIAFEVYDSDNSTTSCSLYIDAVLNATNNAVANDTITYFFPAWSQGVHLWNITCNDGITTVSSATRIFDYDTSEPFIQFTTPSTFNTTIFTGYTFEFAGNVSDNNLWRTNFTVFYPNGTVWLNDFEEFLPITTFYSFDIPSGLINTSSEPNGIYTIFIDVADSHTANLMEEAEVIEKDMGEKKLTYELAYDTVEVAMVGGTAEAEFADVKTTKLEDRYTFDYSFKKEIAKGGTSIFRVTSTEPIIYLEDSPYTAHFILAEKYWLDFEEVKGNKVEVSKIDEFNYDVTVTFEEALSILKFQSLGGLNEANLSISFQINNCVPNWQCDSYGACNVSDESACGSATDLNTCGLPYTGDLSEFTPQPCNYCSRNIVVLNASACVSEQSLHCYNDSNWATCCNITGIASDCIGDVLQTQSDVCVNEICSMFAYSENDITGAVIGTVAKFSITLALLAGTVAIIWIGLWAWNTVGMRRYK